MARGEAARVAGVVAPGLRVTLADPAATLDHVNVWVEPGSGLPLRVELHEAGGTRPVLRTEVTQLDLSPPDSSTTVFRPAASTRLNYEDAVDVATVVGNLVDNALDAVSGGRPGQWVSVAIRHDDVGALRREARADRGADTAGPAHHQCRTPGEPHHGIVDGRAQAGRAAAAVTAPGRSASSTNPS